MNCPHEVSVIVLEMIQHGLDRIHESGRSEEHRRCVVEVNHIRNLPELLQDFSLDKLRFYWETERRAYLGQVAPVESTGFESLWDHLAEWVEQSPETAVAP